MLTAHDGESSKLFNVLRRTSMPNLVEIHSTVVETFYSEPKPAGSTKRRIQPLGTMHVSTKLNGIHPTDVEVFKPNMTSPPFGDMPQAWR